MSDQSSSRALPSNTSLPPLHRYGRSLTTYARQFSHKLKDELCQDEGIERLLPRLSYDSVTKQFAARVMPTHILDIVQGWMFDEFGEMIWGNYLTSDERQHLEPRVGTSFQGFTAPYTQSRKEPDWALVPNTDSMPSIVIETGWTKSSAKLTSDMRLWPLGGRPNVQLVFLVKWAKHTNYTVSGELRVFEPTTVESVGQRYHVGIFPIPQTGPSYIPVTRGELFGVNGLLPGRNAGDVWNLQLSALRRIGERWIRHSGFVPTSKRTALMNIPVVKHGLECQAATRQQDIDCQPE
ncbi:uncharacterized protein BJX67DRAFT_382495 [Aspergillus lucknowensis]|uniref:Uncharacterized protein n=1 Tax=Aspergillus lucknowensis TaxID=176173 RepID=A0ABR4LMP8_9EURO